MCGGNKYMCKRSLSITSQSYEDTAVVSKDFMCINSNS